MKRLLVIFLLLSPLLANAEWTSISKSHDSSEPGAGEYFIDSPSITKNGTYARAWFLVNYYSTQFDGPNTKPYDSAKIYEEFDCSGKRVRFLSYAFYSKKNAAGFVTASFTYNPPTDWSFIGPGEITAGLAKYACR
jgi:hypothetical protein